MYKIAILVIRQDFVWISSKVAPIMCPVVLVQDETGFFLGMRSPNPIYVGSVPIVTVPYSIMNQGLFATSTPSCTSNRPTNTVFSCGLSPINSDNTTTDTNISLENKRRKKASNTKSNKTKDNARKSQPIMTAVRNQEMNKDLSTGTSTTSQETKTLREKIKKFKEKTPDSQLSTTIDPNEEDNADDLSTTIDPNAETNEDNGQRTDIGSDHLSFSADNTLVMSKETDTDKSCTEVYSTTHDESHTEVTKTVKASNQVSCNADIPGKTGTKNDVTEHVMENSPTEDEKIQGEKGDESKNSDDMSAPLFTEATADMSMVSKNSDTEKHTPKVKKRRLGMTGPAFTKSSLSVNVRDVSIELQIPKEQNVVETCTSEGKQVVRKYMCKKCPEMFFTKNGYERHLMHNHKIQNVDQYQPEIVEKTICIFGQDGYETTYQKVDKIENTQKVKLVEYSCDEQNDTSGMQNDEAEDTKMGERDDPNESNNTEGEGNDIRAGVWTLAPISVKPKGKEKEEKTVHCQICSESFFCESGLRTHMDHVHVDYKANEDEILAEKISRQQNVLSSIPKAEKKKRKHTKKEEGKVNRSKNADEK